MDTVERALAVEEKMDRAEKEVEFIRDSVGYLILQEDCDILSDLHDVNVRVEETNGKTKLLHIEGTDKQIAEFLFDLRLRTRDVPVKWITIPYKGVFRKWRFNNQMKKQSRPSKQR